MDKGARLNKRVGKLFETAGFRTSPNSKSTAEHEVVLSPRKKIPVDLHAADPELGVTIVGSNKSGGVDGWTQHVHGYLELGRAANADKVLFVVTGQALDEEQKAYAVHRGACV